MSDTLELTIVTPSREVASETVTSVTAQATLGQVGILPLHIAFVTSLDPGELVYRKASGGEVHLAVSGGYAEVRDDVVTILADEVIPVGEIDRSKAEADLREAETELAEDPLREDSWRDRRWAEARLELSGRA